MVKEKVAVKVEGEVSSDRRWTWFFQGFGVGFAVVGLIASIWWLTDERNDGGNLPPPPPQVEIIANPSIAAPGQEVTLTPDFSGEPMAHPVLVIWTANTGEGLPRGWVPVTEVVIWTAPPYSGVAHIEVTVRDGAGLKVKGDLDLPVIPD